MLSSHLLSKYRVAQKKFHLSKKEPNIWVKHNISIDFRELVLGHPISGLFGIHVYFVCPLFHCDIIMFINVSYKTVTTNLSMHFSCPIESPVSHAFLLPDWLPWAFTAHLHGQRRSVFFFSVSSFFLVFFSLLFLFFLSSFSF